MFMGLLLKDAKPWNQEFMASLAAHSKILSSPTKTLRSSPKSPDCFTCLYTNTSLLDANQTSSSQSYTVVHFACKQK